MEVSKKIFSFKTGKPWRIHVLIWVTFYCLLQLYVLHKWENIWFSVFTATIAMGSYLLAAYGNFLWLMPRWFQSGRITSYLLLSLGYVMVVVVARAIAEYYILFPVHLHFYNLSTGHFSLIFITTILAFIFGGLMYMMRDYILLLQKQEELRRRQASAELNLLKSQVQPHFLFNTLNNLYYLAYKKSKKTPQVIAKLSEIMRYFIDEAPKERVLLHTEINFLKNYIELESIRMVNPLQLEFCEDISENELLLPPMLLIPLVENVFKHGVDKMQICNEVSLHLQVVNKELSFKVKNRMYGEPKPKQNGGIENLRQRLELLFDTRFSFETRCENEHFIACLRIPIL